MIKFETFSEQNKIHAGKSDERKGQRLDKIKIIGRAVCAGFTLSSTSRPVVLSQISACRFLQNPLLVAESSLIHLHVVHLLRS